LYINDLPVALSGNENVTPILYADDTTVIVSSNSHQCLINQAQSVTNLISKWAKDNFLVVNPKKSNLIHFASSGLRTESLLVRMERKSIEHADTCKFLGVYLNYKMCWSEHVNYLSSKLSSSCYILRQLSSTVERETLLSLYYSDFYSHVVYSIIFWGSTHLCLKVFRLQKRAVRIIALKGNRSPSKPIYKELNLLPIPCIYIFLTIMFVKNNLSNFNVNSVFHNHHTRTKSDIHLNFVRTKVTKIGPKEMGIKLYNKLPTFVKEVNNISTFKCKLKSHLLNKMYYSVEEYINDDMYIAKCE
jgi:hypothetical protein